MQYYNGNVFTWKQGRRLDTVSKNGSVVASYDYDENGIRTSKTTADSSYKYILNGSQIVAETWDDCINIYLYDENGSPIGFLHRYENMAEDTYNTYFYEKNMFGDILAIYDENGVKQVSYSYDAFGKSTQTIHVADTRAWVNHLRYRGYYYDKETGFYYLNSRYYDPVTCRFINADSMMSGVNGSLKGYNLFAYCFNNPVSLIDNNGNWPRWATIALGAVAAVAAVAVTVVTLGAAAPAAACTLTAVGMSIGASYAVASTAATVVVTATTVVAAYSGDIAYSAVTGDSLLLDTVFQGNTDAYNTGLAITSIATAGMFELAANSPGVCFVAGTEILTVAGLVAIENISEGDEVLAENPETGEKGVKRVVQTFVNQTYNLVHIYVEDEEIVTTPEHPFWEMNREWCSAIEIRAGDILKLANGKTAIVSKVYSESLSSPVTVYNFEVEDYHTYYVGEDSVLVHNWCSDSYHGGLKKNMIKAGKTSPGSNYQAHHGLPWKFKKQFKKAGINNINDPKFGIWVKSGRHQSWSKKYNDLWKDFLSVEDNLNPESIINYFNKLNNLNVSL